MSTLKNEIKTLAKKLQETSKEFGYDIKLAMLWKLYLKLIGI